MNLTERTTLDKSGAETTDAAKSPNTVLLSGKGDSIFGSRFARRLLIAEATNQTFKFITLCRGKKGYDITSQGAVDSAQLSIGPLDSAEMFRLGLEWFEKNSTEQIDQIIVVSSGLDFFVRRLELPSMRDKDIHTAAAWEADKLIPVPVENSYLLIKKEKKQNGKIFLVAGAVPHTQIDQWDYLKESLAGVIPISVALATLGPKADFAGSAYCFVYSSNDYLNIGFYNSSGLLYSHPIQFSSKKLFNLGESVLTVKRIVEELTNSIEIFYSYFPDISMQGLFLIVSPEQKQTVMQAISEQIEIKITCFDSFPAVSIGGNRNGKMLLDLEYLPLLGALGVEDDDFRFFPQALKKKHENRRFRKISAYGIAVFAAIGLLFGVYWIIDVRRSDSELKRIENLREKASGSSAYREITDYRNSTDVLNSLTKAFESRDIDYSAYLKALSAITPAGVFLENVTASRKEKALEITISGFFDGDISDSDITIVKFMEALKERGIGQLRFQRLGQKLSGPRKIESFQLDGKLGQND